jgi:hypothetical protein
VRISSSRSSPLLPGMRMSVTSTSGSSRRRASSAASASSNALGSMPACFKARLEHPADGGIVVDEPDVKRLCWIHWYRRGAGS